MFEYEIYLMVFFAGLTGGAGHCILMCGPVVVSYSVAMKCHGLLPHLFYNLGRISTYVAIGAVVGLAGSFMGAAEATLVLPRWLQGATMMLSGVLIILMGFGMAGFIPFMKRVEARAVQMPIITKFLEYLRDSSSTSVLYPMGMVLGLIPCGLVYSMLIASAGAAMDSEEQALGVLKGITMMLVFGLGTAIPLLAVGRLSGFLGGKMKTRFYRLSAIIVIVMGVLFLYKGFSMRGMMH